MGKLSRGYLGGFQGQLGTAYGCFWRKKDLIKAMPRKVKRVPTAAQLDYQLRFGVVMAFLTPLKALIAAGYHTSNPDQSPLNAASSYHLKHAVTGAAPDYRINPAEVKFSKGDLEAPIMPGVTTGGAAKIIYDWSALSDPDSGKPTDLATFMVYNPILKKFTLLRNAVARSVLSFTLQLPASWIGHAVHCYMGFTSAIGKQSSDSAYIGELPVV